MKKKQFLKEIQRNKILENSGIGLASGANLIVVDIQPEYERYFTFNINNFTTFLNENFNSIQNLTFLYNGEDTLGMVSEVDYMYWWEQHGLDNDVITQSTFYDKGYAFFRYCMDEGIDDDEIVDLIKFMISHNINDSREINKEMWDSFMSEYQYNESEIRDILELADDMINIPDLMNFLKNYSGKIVLCGGGIDECLKEVEIALMALNKNYNVLTKYTY